MICPNCAPMFATTREQLDQRLKNMAQVPGAQVHPCDKCGGTDWATSHEMIKEAVPEAKPKWWMRLFFPKGPPSWRTLRIINGVFAVFFLALAVASTEKLLVIVDAWIGGFNLAAFVHAGDMMKSRRIFDQMKEGFDMMVGFNRALIEARIASFTRHDGDDDTPIAPKLH